MKIHCPELPQNLKEETEWAGLEAWAREEEADISGCRLTGITEPGADLSRLTFRGVRWERCRLNEAEAERAAFIDAEFVGCDLSGANFHGLHGGGGSAARGAAPACDLGRR